MGRAGTREAASLWGCSGLGTGHQIRSADRDLRAWDTDADTVSRMERADLRLRNPNNCSSRKRNSPRAPPMESTTDACDRCADGGAGSSTRGLVNLRAAPFGAAEHALAALLRGAKGPVGWDDSRSALLRGVKGPVGSGDSRSPDPTGQRVW